MSANMATAGRGRVALVVDDQRIDRKQLAGVLAAEGWSVLEASDGRQAVNKSRSNSPAVIFMDIVMPGMDGFQACRQLGANAETRSIPVVFVSTKSQRVDHVWARAQGGRALIAKPVDRQAVLDALQLLA